MAPQLGRWPQKANADLLAKRICVEAGSVQPPVEMHPLLQPMFAAVPPTGQPGAILLLLYFSTVPSLIMGAIAGRFVGWGIFQGVWLVFGIALFWRWTDGASNGVRMIGIYVVYACLNLMSVLIFLIADGASQQRTFLIWPVFGFILAAFIAVMTVRIIRGFPAGKDSE
jgi:hypothetical protein